MLNGIQKIGSQLISALARLKPGQRILIADAFFPAADPDTEIVSGEGMQVQQLVDAISSIIPVSEVSMMAVVDGDNVGHSKPLVQSVEKSLAANGCKKPKPTCTERFDCYAETPTVTIITTHEVQYGNFWLTRAEGQLKGFAPELTAEVLEVLHNSGHGQYLSIMQADCDISMPTGIPTIEFKDTQSAIEALLPLQSADHKKFSPHAAACLGGNKDQFLGMLKTVWQDDIGFNSFEKPVIAMDQASIELELAKPRFHVLNVRTKEPGNGCIFVNKGLTRGAEPIAAIQKRIALRELNQSR